MATYPGQVVPSPATGAANYTPITPGPATGTSNYASSPTAPAIGSVVKAPISQGNPTVAQPVKNNNPYNLSPATGIPARTPLETPLGVSPQFEKPTQNWTYDYGDGSTM
jgi:hypothetical protein